jgi:hypothetical protein
VELVGGAGGATLRTGPSVEVTGEAITNNRKGKLIPSYELALKGTWSGAQPPCRAVARTRRAGLRRPAAAAARPPARPRRA